MKCMLFFAENKLDWLIYNVDVLFIVINTEAAMPV